MSGRHDLTNKKTNTLTQTMTKIVFEEHPQRGILAIFKIVLKPRNHAARRILGSCSTFAKICRALQRGQKYGVRRDPQFDLDAKFFEDFETLSFMF